MLTLARTDCLRSTRARRSTNGARPLSFAETKRRDLHLPDAQECRTVRDRASDCGVLTLPSPCNRCSNRSSRRGGRTVARRRTGLIFVCS